VDIGAKLAQIENRLRAIERQSRLGSASIDDTAIEVRDAAGSLRALVGQQSDGTTAVNVVNGGPPPAPATPTVSPALGGIAVGWDGSFAGGVVIPLDWARVEVHTAAIDDFTPLPETLQATIETPQGGIVYIPTTTALYVRLVARNTSGTASTPTDTVGPYEPRPVSDDIGPGGITETLIADGAITTPKVYANAITTALLAAGSVDATALKADAITGKTITGGTINGAEFHSDDGAGATVDIEDGSVTATAASGWKILVDPTQTLPVIGFLNPSGATAGAINGNDNASWPGLNISSGPFTDGAVNDWRWLTYLGPTPSTNHWYTRRIRHSDPSIVKGGSIYLGPTYSQLGLVDSASPSTNTIFQVSDGVFTMDEGRVAVDPPASANAALFISAKTGHTGALLWAQLNGVDKFSVTPDGHLTAAGTVFSNELSVAATTWQSYTPVVSGAGAATFATRDGWYYKIGKLVFVQTHIALSAAGTGTGTVTISLPSTPYRGSANRRQYLPAYAGGIAAGTNSGVGGTAVGNINFTGSGAQIDQLRGPTDILIRGDNLSATSVITLSGWYREA
jgi:hypothetical protein